MSKQTPPIIGINLDALHYGDTAYLTVPLDPKFTPIEIRHVSRTPSPTKHGETAYHFTDVGSDAGTIKCDREGAVHTVVCLGELGVLNGLSPKQMRVVLDNQAVVDGTIAGLAFGDIAYLTVPQCPVHSPIAVRLVNRTWPPRLNGAPAHHFTDVETCQGTIKCDDAGQVLAIKPLGGMSELADTRSDHMRVVVDCPGENDTRTDETDVSGIDPIGDITVKPITKEQAEIRKLQETIQAMNIERENLQATIQENADEIRKLRGQLLDANDIALHVEPGYLQLANVLRGALQQAQHGKGAERHADDKPFHQQPIIAINEILGSVDGLAYQVIKKVKESKGLPTLDAKLREIYGAINYAAAMAIMYRNAETGEADDE